MPPTNEARRDRLADAAIELLARTGARGLTHRAVDAEAAEPPGTTSRYFRTRDALLSAVVERIWALHVADLGRAPAGPVDPAAIADHLAGMVYHALTRDRSRHLAGFALFLESTRIPALHQTMTGTRITQVEQFRKMHQAAGMEFTPRQAAMLIAAINGVIFLALTTPVALGLRSPADVRDLIRETVHNVHRGAAQATGPAGAGAESAVVGAGPAGAGSAQAPATGRRSE